MHHPPQIGTTPNTELLGTTAGIILTAVVAVAGLAVLIGATFWADLHPATERLPVPRRGEVSGSGTSAEVSPGQGDNPREHISDRHVPEGGHPHGKPASWALVAVVLAAFTTGGLAIIAHAWWLMWTCAGICLLALPAGKIIGIMNETVAWGSTPAATRDSRADQEADPGDRKVLAGDDPPV
jgi:hypothetical protein